MRISTAEKLRAHYLRDLSEGGIFVRAEKTLALETEVDVELFPPGWDQPLPLHGRVVRLANDESARKANSVGMGIRFEGLSQEVADKLTALVAEHSRPPSLAAVDDGELERTKMQVQGLVLELGASRESSQVAERELLSLRQKLQAAQGAIADLSSERDQLSERQAALKGELERHRAAAAAGPSPADDEKSASLRAELADARMRLSEAEGKIEAYESELRILEEDDAATRSLAELLAKDKAALEKARKQDQEKALNALEGVRRDAEQSRLQLTQELESARRRAEETERQLEQEKSNRSEIENALGMERKARASADGRADAAQRSADEANAALLVLRGREQDFRRTRDGLDTERARAGGLERQLAEARSQLERARAKERDLRRLLGLLSSKSGDEVVLVDEGGEVLEDDLSVEAPTLEPAAPPTAPTLETASDALSTTLGEDLAVEMPAPPKPPEEAPSMEEMAEEVALDVDFTPEFTLDGLPAPPEEPGQFNNLPAPAGDFVAPASLAAAKIEDLGDFQKKIRGGAKLGRTERFFRHTPTDRTEVLVSSWLENVDSWQVLSTLAMGRMSEDHLSKTLFQFYKQGLLDVV